jgi:hypothetical protein
MRPRATAADTVPLLWGGRLSATVALERQITDAEHKRVP